MKNAYYALIRKEVVLESGFTSGSSTAAHYDDRNSVLDRGGRYVNRSAWRVKKKTPALRQGPLIISSSG